MQNVVNQILAQNENTSTNTDKKDNDNDGHSDIALEELAGLCHIKPQSPAQLPAHDINSHIAMSRVNIANRNNEMTPTNALWDSGAFPKSHVSLQTLQNLGLQQGVNINRELHKTVSGNFSSIGTIKLKVQLGGRRCPIVSHTFTVSDSDMDVVLGNDFLNQVGTVINFYDHTIHCVKLTKRNYECKMNMLKFHTRNEIKSLAKSITAPNQYDQKHQRNKASTKRLLDEPAMPYVQPTQVKSFGLRGGKGRLGCYGEG